MVNEGQTFVRCRDCGKYGGDVSSPSALGMRYHDR
jgi:hypothetical protein